MSKFNYELWIKSKTKKELIEEFGEPKLKITALVPKEKLHTSTNKVDEKVISSTLDNLRNKFIYRLEPESEYERFKIVLDHLEHGGMLEHTFYITGFVEDESLYEFEVGLYHTPIQYRSAEELREDFLEHLRFNARYAHNHAVSKFTTVAEAVQDAVESVTFGFLTYLDGVNCSNLHGFKLYGKDAYREDDANEWLDITAAGYELHDEIFPIFKEEKDDEN